MSSSSTSRNSSRAEVARWIGYLRHLECFSKDPSNTAAVDAAAKKVIQSFPERPEACRVTSKQTWEQLVLQLKVPLRLGTALSKVAQHQPNSFAMHAAAGLLQHFFESLEGFSSNTCAVAGSEPCNSPCEGRCNGLRNTAAQQLEQAGLFKQLPQLLTTTTQELTAWTACLTDGPSQSAAAAAAASATNLPPLWPAAFNAALAAGGHTTRSSIQEAYTVYLVAHLTALNNLCRYSTMCNPDRMVSARYAAATLPAAMQLLLAVMQHASAKVQHLDAADKTGEYSREQHMAAATKDTARTAVFLLKVSQSVKIFTSNNEAVSELQSPNILHSIATLCAVVSLAELVNPGTGQPGHKRSSRSRSSKVISDAVVSGCAELFQLVGVDSKVVLWAAEGSQTNLSNGSECGRLVQILQQASEAEQQEAEQLQVLLSSVLWRMTTHADGRLASERFSRLCSAAVECTSSVLKNWSKALELHQIDDQQQQDLPSHPWLQQQCLLAAWLDEVLSSALQVAGNLLGLRQEMQGMKPETTDHSRTASSKAALAKTLVPILVFVFELLVALQPFNQLAQSCIAGSQHSPQGAPTADSALPSGATTAEKLSTKQSAEDARRAFLQCFMHHASGLLTVLESLVRSLAAGGSTRTELGTGTAAEEVLVGCCTLLIGPTARIISSCRPGSSREHQQLYALLFSMMKADKAMTGSGSEPDSCHVIDAANGLLESSLVHAGQRSTAGACAGAELPSCPNAAASGFDAAVPELYHCSSALWALPSLGVFGRWCLRSAEKLQQMSMHNLSSMITSMKAQSSANQIQCWLQHPSISAQLTAAGYKPQALLQQLADLQTACQAVRDNFTALMQQLQAAGLAFTSMAIPGACNNTACTNVSGPSELQLVSGRSCVCAGCHTARYCSRTCQKQHWSQHKPVCQVLKQKQAAAAGGAGGGAAEGATSGAA